MYAICGCLGVAALANSMIKPVDTKYFMRPEDYAKAGAVMGVGALSDMPSPSYAVSNITPKLYDYSSR